MYPTLRYFCQLQVRNTGKYIFVFYINVIKWLKEIVTLKQTFNMMFCFIKDRYSLASIDTNVH